MATTYGDAPRPLTSRRRALRERPGGRFELPHRIDYLGDVDELDALLPVRSPNRETRALSGEW